ncbi:MAG: CHAT domain-containing protein [Ilumatobacteraceae bacterium]
MPLDIRRVAVELLRHGPRHNQLLSPLTDYLAVCGDFPGGVVHVPYEHAEAQNLLDDLRYTVSSAEPSDRLSVVKDRAGTQLAAMFASVPGLAGVLAGEHSQNGSITHLRVILSAAELALLPFELAKVPVGAGSVGDDWLALQPDRPLCMTRHVRGVPAPNGWPNKPRILFVSGDDVPFEQHLDVFQRVLEPWRTDELCRDPDSDRHWSSELLTVIERASLDEIRAATVDQAFTHVHVLAHGAEIEGRRTARHGIALGDRVVTGGDLALALASSIAGERDLPSVVTLAACDSAAQGSIVTPGGSVAHDLHASGIPLVVASQFPISEQASVPFTEAFYSGEMRGIHPFETLTKVRRLLATQFADEHAWASLVVYEALPENFDSCLSELNYWQSRRAHENAMTQIERSVLSDESRMDELQRSGVPFADDFRSPAPADLAAAFRRVGAAAEQLPCTGFYAVECDGLRAAGAKRTAEVAYWLGRAPDVTPARRDELLEHCLHDLDTALGLYRDGVRSLLSTADDQAHRKVTTHWIVGQVMLLQAILGRDVDIDLGGIARATMNFDCDHPDAMVRAWATVSEIEQAILELAAAGASEDVAERALRCAHELVRAVGDDAEQIATTRRQMRRFATWWGDEGFVRMLHDLGVDRPVSWDGAFGVISTAAAVADVLLPPRRSAMSATSRAAQRTVSPSAAVPAGGLLADAVVASEPRSGTFEIEMLPARNGDCLWLGYGPADSADHHVLIDCGAVDAADLAADRVRSVTDVELFILTHIDADHISGAIPLFGDADVAGRFDDVWFNGWRQLRGFLSVAQGEAFSAILERADRPFTWNGTSGADDPPPPIVTDPTGLPTVQLGGGMRLTVMSPTPAGLRQLASHWHAALAELDPQRAMLGRRARPSPPESPSTLDLEALAASGPTKDTSIPNLSSIAVLAEFGGRAVLLTGDAHADVLAASIRTLQAERGAPGQRLRLDALKLSHHGSANATTRELLEQVVCSNYLIPTDGSTFYHPDREAIARVVVHGGTNPTLHFSYRTDLNSFWEDPGLQDRYRYSTAYPTDESGLIVTL